VFFEKTSVFRQNQCFLKKPVFSEKPVCFEKTSVFRQNQCFLKKPVFSDKANVF